MAGFVLHTSETLMSRSYRQYAMMQQLLSIRMIVQNLLCHMHSHCLISPTCSVHVSPQGRRPTAAILGGVVEAEEKSGAFVAAGVGRPCFPEAYMELASPAGHHTKLQSCAQEAKTFADKRRECSRFYGVQQKHKKRSEEQQTTGAPLNPT